MSISGSRLMLHVLTVIGLALAVLAYVEGRGSHFGPYVFGGLALAFGCGFARCVLKEEARRGREPIHYPDAPGPFQ